MERGRGKQQPAGVTSGAWTMAGALRACERAVRENPAEPLDGLREPLRVLSLCAHRANVPPGGMVIHLRHALDASARAVQLPPRRAKEVRIKAVALAIAAYMSRGEGR